MGKAWYQYKLVSWQILATCCFIKWFIFFTCALAWGLYVVCSCYCILNSWLTPCITWATKCDSLSELIFWGTPNRGIISCTKALTTFSVLFYKGKLLAILKKCLWELKDLLFLGNLEKSICYTSPGKALLVIVPVFSVTVVLGLFLRQILQVEITSSIVSFNFDAITLSF